MILKQRRHAFALSALSERMAKLFRVSMCMRFTWWSWICRHSCCWCCCCLWGWGPEGSCCPAGSGLQQRLRAGAPPIHCRCLPHPCLLAEARWQCWRLSLGGQQAGPQSPAPRSHRSAHHDSCEVMFIFRHCALHDTATLPVRGQSGVVA